MNQISENVRETLKALAPFKRLVLACSGGVDSMVLLHILEALKVPITVAHLNHQLRGRESDLDEVLVEEVCERLEVEFVSGRIRIPRHGNLEANARKKRYEFLESVREECGADYIVTAHHWDDQLETILMNQRRGAKWRGLRGMEKVSDSHIRPLLEVNKAEILNYAKTHQIPYREDSSNFDLSYQRNYLRHQLIPQLKEENPSWENQMKSLMDAASEKLRDLNVQVALWLKEKSASGSFKRDDFLQLSPDIQGEILLELLERRDIYKKNIRELTGFIRSAKSGRQMSIKGVTFWAESDRIAVTRMAQKVSPEPATLEPGETALWGDYQIKNGSSDAIQVRSWQAGDRFRPLGMPGHKKLQDLFTDRKVPRRLRHQIPVILDQKGDIIYVADLHRSAKSKAFPVLISKSTL
jgi:tRNA(Ile)-lysidine synthase